MIEELKLNVNEVGKFDRNCFHSAVRGGKNDTVEYLGHKFPTLTKAKDAGGKTAFQLANSTTRKLLIDKFDLDVFEIDSDGRNGFLQAAFNRLFTKWSFSIEQDIQEIE